MEKLYKSLQQNISKNILFQYGPGIVELWFESPYGPFVMIQTVVPVEPFVQKVVHRIFTPNTLWMRFVTRWSLWGETIMVTILNII